MKIAAHSRPADVAYQDLLRLRLDEGASNIIGTIEERKRNDLIKIPRHERSAIHKLIVADRRQGDPDQLKARKDRAQAKFLVAVLSEDRPDELAEAYDDALSRGPRWRDRINASLKRMPETTERLSALV
ncbi:MAG: GSU2403 family nucleotidyltransferase fold protein [Oricola sp.]